jgi:sialic acid synthase SpsE
MRRSIYASKDIEKNSTIDFKNVDIVRPFKSLEPNYLKNIVGKKAKILIKKNKPISMTDLKN